LQGSCSGMKTDAKTSRQTPWALPRQYAECSRAAAGSAAGFISPETCCSGSQRPTRAWSPLLCGRCLAWRKLLCWWSVGMTWPAPLLSASLMLLSSCSRPKRTCWRSTTTQSPTGKRCGAPPA
jgi:hypothetical protein